VALLDASLCWHDAVRARESTTMTTAVKFEKVSRRFGAVRAVDEVSMEVAAGEFFAMLGPSGSGKTTCLRLVAGFEQPDAGHIEIFGATAEGVPPYRRNVNTVFQDYALFPHMNVIDNVAYGLMIRGIPRQERREKARQALALVKLAGMEERRPSQLSGGQRQRVALARALVNEPKVLLLDEPLGALDLKLREQMQVELKVLQRKVGITFIFVTHDQGEALAMADRVAIFNEGRIVQVGTPEEVYEQPRSRFVADFVGSSNVLSPEWAARLGGSAHWTSLRPEKISLLPPGSQPPAGNASIEGRVASLHYQGAVTRLGVETTAGRLNVAAGSGAGRMGEGTHVALHWPRGAMHAMEDEA
jgi:putative spermidine/putrescine transport system ATP-binding protein